MLEKTPKSPLDYRDIKPVNPKGTQSWIFIGRTDAEAPILWPPDVKNWLIGKGPDAGKNWGWEENGMTKNEMVGWHHWFNGHEFEQAPGVGDGQGSLECCSPWGCKELDMTKQLTEAEDIKKRCQEYTEELYRKYLHDPDNHDDVITDLEPDILECEVKWALESITMNKASGGDGIPVELFQILKDDAVKVLHSICQQIWKTQQWPQDWKRSVFIPIPKKSNAKECSNYRTIALISHAS